MTTVVFDCFYRKKAEEAKVDCHVQFSTIGNFSYDHHDFSYPIMLLRSVDSPLQRSISFFFPQKLLDVIMFIIPTNLVIAAKPTYRETTRGNDQEGLDEISIRRE